MKYIILKSIKVCRIFYVFYWILSSFAIVLAIFKWKYANYFMIFTFSQVFILKCGLVFLDYKLEKNYLKNIFKGDI